MIKNNLLVSFSPWEDKNDFGGFTSERSFTQKPPSAGGRKYPDH